MGKGVINQIESGEIYTLIKAHCERTADGAVYEEGWSDQRIFDERLQAGGVLKITNVTSLRERACGPLVKKMPITELTLLEQRIKKLEDCNDNVHRHEAKISQLETQVESHRERIRDLEQKMTTGG